MLLEQMNWEMVTEYLKHDDRIVVVLGATEEHGQNTLATDTQCPWEIAKVACERRKVMLAPAVPFGPSSFSLDYPGTISMKSRTYMDMIQDILDSLVRVGFKRIMFFSGHGGNTLARNVIKEYVIDRSDLTLTFREWYQMPRTSKRMHELGSTDYDHASWLESFPWINQPVPIKAKFKEQTHSEEHSSLSAAESRLDYGDGVGGGDYTKPEAVMREYFEIAVQDLEDYLDNRFNKTTRAAN
jgi:creatinine amidohydrolase